jgi:hypothetical protein
MTVNSAGLATGMAPGTAMITANSGSINTHTNLTASPAAGFDCCHAGCAICSCQRDPAIHSGRNLLGRKHAGPTKTAPGVRHPPE